LPEWSKFALVSRTEWGCPDGQDSPRGAPAYTDVTHIVLHHTATTNDAPRWDAVVRSIWNFHVFANSWKDIGYNYLIDPDGVIYEGRAGGDDVVGAHFICANHHTMGVALIGTFSTSAPTEFALDSLVTLLAWKCDQKVIDPLGSSWHPQSELRLDHILGHRDGNLAPPESIACPRSTQCPGERLYELLPDIRKNVKLRMQSGAEC
jgi:N-acetylmuramoyl-L-alanine amidase-like protein